LDQGEPKGISMNSEITALASMVGIGSGSGSGAMPLDQVKGRVFIEKIDEKLNFRSDTYFNTYNPSSVDPVWKSTIKSAVGWHKLPINAEEAMWQHIVMNYLENVMLDITEEGSVIIEVTHEVPQRAAKIANTIIPMYASFLFLVEENKGNQIQTGIFYHYRAVAM